MNEGAARGRRAGLAALAVLPGLALADEAVLDSGDTAWMMIPRHWC